MYYSLCKDVRIYMYKVNYPMNLLILLYKNESTTRLLHAIHISPSFFSFKIILKKYIFGRYN